MQMKPTEQVIIKRASINDAEEILDLQKVAYVSEAEIYNDFTIPPLHQTISEILSEFNNQAFLKATLEDRIVGAIRSYLKSGTCYIGKLIVHPEHQNRGNGTRLLHGAERLFPDAERYELFTGMKSEKNLYLYGKNGYRIFRSERVSEDLILVFLEKTKKVSRQPATRDADGNGSFAC